MITNRALLANQAAIHERTSTSSAATMVSWLPLYHDMGLCLGLLMPIYAGSAAVLLEPETFLVRPERWLQAISGVPEARSAAPDFAYAWCARRVGERAKAGLDLSGWKVSVSGAEPVRADTLRAFYAAFAGCGLSSRTLTPSYGLAEATLFVTGASVADEPVIHRYDRAALNRGLAVPADEDGGGGAGLAEAVGCGRPGSGIRVAVVDPGTRRPCPERTVGEIWVDSPSNGAGYWGRPEESRETFGAQLSGAPRDSAQRWLRTGDLGFMDGNELFVTGRRKDLIIVHGVNYYPHDFERLAQQAHPLLGEGLAAAFVLDDANRVTVVVEAGRPRRAADSTGDSGGGDGSDDSAAAAAAAAAVRAVTAELPVMTDVVVVPTGQLPRTTSGKVRRGESAEALRGGRLPVLAQWPRSHIDD
jgi:nonribosomal peptide synthetase protein BlmVI